jgi:hypothetical protein
MLSKIERRKIALRNLRKAWAAKGVRKNMRIVSKKRIPRNIASKRSIKNICEKHGPALAIKSISEWCIENSGQLRERRLLRDSLAYHRLAKYLFRAQVMAFHL